MQNVNPVCGKNMEILNSRAFGKYSAVATVLRKVWWKSSCASVETSLKPSIIHFEVVNFSVVNLKFCMGVKVGR